MPALDPGLRGILERVVVSARDAAERASRAALERHGVMLDVPHASLDDKDRALRRKLRAEMSRLGSLELLVNECAYEQWHRMLFARFLAENSLLVHPSGISVSLADCAELASSEGFPDAWGAAASYASGMLPGIFRVNDPTLQIRLAPDERQELEGLLERIPQPVFASDDGLGWVYQFWQARAKGEVNKSGRKIGGADISPVTQLFTEHYMVEFLLHNTLGAWWAARHPDSGINASLTYLRRLEDGSPAAGVFEGWPSTTRELRVLDPCCGSGHFLVAAADLLARMRAEEEHLTEPDSYDLVLSENLFGLELDARCTQLAAFALALQAWKKGGYRELPIPSVACSGIPVGGQREEWTRLADGDAQLATTLGRLYDLFRNAPDLGSLIDPSRVAGDKYQSELMAADFSKVEQLLERALARDRTDDPAASVFGEAARGVARAAEILRGEYHLVVTNVPYLTRQKQTDILRTHVERFYPLGKADLATAFVERCRALCSAGGTYTLVMPHNYLFLGSYQRLREMLLSSQTWNFVARIGSGGFQTISGDIVNVVLVCKTNNNPSQEFAMSCLNVSSAKTLIDKNHGLRFGDIARMLQSDQLDNPAAVITMRAQAGATKRLNDYADVLQGISTTDLSRYILSFWEVPFRMSTWEYYHTAPSASEFSGCSYLIRWESGQGSLAHIGTAHKGKRALGLVGMTVAVNHNLNVGRYLGVRFDGTSAVVIPKRAHDLLAVRAFMLDQRFADEVRMVDQSLSVTESSFARVPFDLSHWQKVADEQYPDGLPEPYSDDPTQWLFKGSITDTTDPLQVAVARLLGYRWPEQVEDGLEEDADGIVCLPPVAGELPAAERVRSLLARAFGERWSPALQSALLASAGASDLSVWLRDDYFVQHCRLFHNRPFVWHVWDGRKDGFSALVNYHKLDRARLERLVYTFLGDWTRAQADAARNDVPGADLRLAAAQDLKRRLELVLHGEPPYDIFVRWKRLSEQPIGWEPDLNDGVRLNVRPFVEAKVLRARFTVSWNKDRGTDPSPNAGGTTERHNDRHLPRAEKTAARERGGA